MRQFYFLLLVNLLASCGPTTTNQTVEETESQPIITDSAHWIVEQAIARHGGEKLGEKTIYFTFRDREYIAERVGGQFMYQRTYTSKEGEYIEDTLSGSEFRRLVNGEPASLTEKDSSAYANSLNSVMYFAFLPYFLLDEAVNLEYQGVSTAFGRSHYELKVTFAEDGGGKDFEDEYAYWFSTDGFTLDYLAYNFLINGGGARFREAYNAREIKGVRVQDYINYKPLDANRRDVLAFDDLLQAGELDTLSHIELEEVRIE